VELEIKGSRAYFHGNTYPFKEQIKALQAHWDPDERAWWVGKSKLSAAEELVNRTENQSGGSDSARSLEVVDSNTRILGRAKYKGKSGYLMLWEGSTKHGPAVKLAFRDGSKIFWASAAEVTIEKYYESRERYGQIQYMTFGRLNYLAEEFKIQKQAEEATEKKRLEEAKKSPEEKMAEIDTLINKLGFQRAPHQSGTGLVTECASFTSDGKDGREVGEIFTCIRKGHTEPDTYVVTSKEAPYLHTSDMCEDMDCFCGIYGWQTPYSAMRVVPIENAASAEGSH
jgi:hypothetical protein